MAHPYQKWGHTNDPKWLDGLNRYKEKAESGDTERAIKNYDLSPDVTRKASYIPGPAKKGQ
jgi:hypothetical protein